MPFDGTLNAMDSDCDRAWREFISRRTWSSGSEDQADYVLHRLVKALRPSTDEWRARQAVVQRVEQVLAGMPDFQPSYGDSADAGCLARVVVFGSFCSSLYHKASDLDLTITGLWRNKHGQLLEMHSMGPKDTADMLHRIRRALMARCVAAADPSNPPMVVNARVPLVMYTDAASGVAVDISVCNHGGAFKSRFTWELVQFDARLEALFRLVKLWAEVHALNDPKTGTLNSWSLTQMVIFHLQRCQPPILPPLWLLFHNEPPQGPRPLEQALQEQQQQQQHNSGLTHRQRQQQSILKAGAPYSLLKICEQQRQRYQPAYSSQSRSSSRSRASIGVCEEGLTELLAGFFVRFCEVLRQWLEYGRHRDEKMCTWLGTWHRGAARWQHDYLAAFEDPFDAADNTARTLGTASRHDGGCWKLLDQLARACAACRSLTNPQDLDALLLVLFETEAGEVLQPGFDPIAHMLQCQQQQQQQQRQAPRQRQGQRQQQQQSLQQLGRQQGQQQQQQGEQPKVDYTGIAIEYPVRQQQQRDVCFTSGVAIVHVQQQQQQQQQCEAGRDVYLTSGVAVVQHPRPQQQQRSSTHHERVLFC